MMNAPACYDRDILDRIQNRHCQVREPDDTWRNQAACQGHNPDMWFPVGVRGKYADQHPNPYIARAKTICRTCPVRIVCLQFALDFEHGRDTRHGIWGGMTEPERDTLVRHLRRKLGRHQK